MIQTVDNNILLKITNLAFARGDKPIFTDLNMQIKQGQIVAIMGPSGTGKTTLLKIIGGQLHPDAGKVVFEKQNVHNLNTRGLYKLRKKMGMLFQSGALLTDINVFENVAFPLREHTDLSKSMIRDLVLIKLHAVGLRGAAYLMPSELSGGMARRVAMARAIALDPDFIMYDEPFTGQDPISMGVLVKLIKQLNQALGLTSVVVSHDIKEATSIADYIYIISNGKVVGEGTPEEVNNSDSKWLQQFMQGLADGPVPFHYPASDYAKEILGT